MDLQFLLSSVESQEESDLLNLPEECSQKSDEDCKSSCVLKKNAGCIADFQGAAKELLQGSEKINSEECAPFLSAFLADDTKGGILKDVETTPCSKEGETFRCSRSFTFHIVSFFVCHSAY